MSPADAMFSYGRFVNIYLTTWQYIPEDSKPQCLCGLLSSTVCGFHLHYHHIEYGHSLSTLINFFFTLHAVYCQMHRSLIHHFPCSKICV
jgi:hypothetical protein